MPSLQPDQMIIMATINHILIKDKDKSSVSDRNYTLCGICEFNGYPNGKVVYEYSGLGSEHQGRFIYKITEYNYALQKRTRIIVHAHKCNDELINRLVNQSLGNTEDTYYDCCGGADK